MYAHTGLANAAGTSFEQQYEDWLAEIKETGEYDLWIAQEAQRTYEERTHKNG